MTISRRTLAQNEFTDNAETPPSQYPVVFLADLRFPGGTSTALAAEIAALGRLGLHPGLLWVKGAPLPGGREIEPRLSRQIAQAADLLSTDEVVTTPLAIVQHAASFARLPARPPKLKAGRVIVVIHEPWSNLLSYDLPACLENIRESLGADVELAPVSPIVRRSLSVLPCRLTPFDWPGLIDPARFLATTRTPRAGQLIVGRHSRPSLTKWPDTRAEALLAWPDLPGVTLRAMGAPADLAEHYGALPPHWTILTFGQESVETYLQSLDTWVYTHASTWCEAFGFAALEAMAAGLPVILPPYMRETFGDGPLYAEGEAIAPLLHRLRDDLGFRAETGAAAQATSQRYDLSRYGERLQAALGTTPIPAPKISRHPKKHRVVMVTSNGVGLGHLTRLMAVARRFGPDVETAFLTMSQGFRLAEEAGYLTQYLPFHRQTGQDPDIWNEHLAAEIIDFLSLYRPGALVFDGTSPYVGVAAAMARFPAMHRFWMRRALWSPSHIIPDTAGAFDSIIEPGEVSSRFDSGATAEQRANVRLTGPITLIDASDAFARTKARVELGLPQDGLVIGMSLGSGRNFDLGRTRAALVAEVLRHEGVTLVEIRSPIAAASPAPSDPRHRIVTLYPVFRLHHAFDGMISGAGYNSVHEAVAGQIPTLFVPNEAPDMDRQALRARHLDAVGAGLIVQQHDELAVKPAVARLLDGPTRDKMRQRLAALVRPNGAQAAADFIREQMMSLRCDLSPRTRSG